MHRGDVDDGAPPMLDDSGWDALESWDDTDAPSWFRARVMVPDRFEGASVSLSLKVGGYLHSLFNAEALAYVDGELVQGLDAYHHDIPLAERAEGGREYLVALYVFWKPDFKKTDWQPTSIRPHPDLEPGTEVQLIDRAAEAFYWDAATAYDVALSLPEDSVDRVRILGALDRGNSTRRFPRPGQRRLLPVGPCCCRPSSWPRTTTGWSSAATRATTRGAPRNSGFGVPASAAREVDLLERDEGPASLGDGSLTFDVAPYEVRTFALEA